MSSLSRIMQWRFVAVTLLLVLLWTVRPIGVEAPRSIETAFDTDRAFGRLATILGDQRPHPTGSEAGNAVMQRLLQQIRQDGFTPIVRDRFHCSTLRAGAAICARPRNILFWVTKPGDDAIMVTAHHDSVPAGPGAADDGMGVAVALEVAHLIKAQPVSRPVLVLITDAEEARLVGAAAFAAHDPLASKVGAVVNLEARGTTGIANMFQTSRPNGRDIAALARGGLVPSANSLATNLYDHLPNDTDLTMLLPLGIDAANFAVIGGGKRYHTPLDNLDHLDRASLRHMGASALAAVRGFSEVDHKGPEGLSVFADLDRHILLVLPYGAAALLLFVGLGAVIILFVRVGGGQPWRALLAPPAAIIAGTALAMLTGVLVAAIRPEAAFATAYPVAIRLAYASAALLGASLVVQAMKVTGGVRVTAAAWIWLSGLVAALFMLVPGLSTLVDWSLPIIMVATIASFVPAGRPFIPWLMALAAISFSLVCLPLGGGLENALFAENAAPISLFLIWMFLFLMPAAGRSFRFVPIVCTLLLAGGVVAALMVPAYTPDAPRHLNIVHEDVDGKGAFLAYDNGPLPDAMRSAARFAATPDANGNWHAPAPRLADEGQVSVVQQPAGPGLRAIRIRADGPSSDRQEYLIEKGRAIRRIAVNGDPVRVKGPITYVGCSGRPCGRFDLLMIVDAGQPLPVIQWRRVYYGAGSAAAAIVAARPDTAVPVHSGDQRSIMRTVSLTR